MQESALLHSFLLLWNFHFLQWLLILGEVGGKEIWTGVTRFSGFPGTSCGLNFIRSVMTCLLSCCPISCQDADAHNCSDTRSWQRSCQKCNFSLTYAAQNGTISMSRVDSHGNCNVFMGRLITVMLVNEELQELCGNYCPLPVPVKEEIQGLGENIICYGFELCSPWSNTVCNIRGRGYFISVISIRFALRPQYRMLPH